jgi:hypothetical protein
MKWYSVKKYKPIPDAMCLILFEDNQYEVARFGYHEKTNQDGFLDIENDYLCCNVTHFSIIEPVEIEE